jgi:hypothetical protein
MAIEIMRGAKKLGELHPLVGPDVTPKMKRITAMVSTETPTISSLRSLSADLRADGVESSNLDRKSSVRCEGIRKTQATATGMATMAVKKKTQCQVTYCTKSAPIIRPSTTRGRV